MRTIILAVAGLAFGATACSSGGTSVEVQRNSVAAVSVTLPSPSLVAGQTGQAVATPRDATGAPLTNRPIVWQSSSPAIASVSDAGLISAATPGTTVISATSEGMRGEGSLSVMALPPVPVATVSVTLSPSSLVVGQTANATATLRDAGGTDLTGRAVSWSSSNAGVASVNSNGVVTAVSAGSTNIVATSEGKNGSAALTVTVTLAPVASVTVSPATASVPIGQTRQFSATLRDAAGIVLSGRTITWTSNSTAVATVSASGLVTAIAAGPATITATSESINGTASVTVTVPPPPPSGSSPEPGGSDVILWQDNFDRPSLSELLAPYATRGTMELVPGRSGRAVRFVYTAGSTDNLIERSFATTTDIYFRFWYRSSPGADPSCQKQNDSGFKWFMAWRANGEPRYTMSVTNADGVPWQGRPNAGLEFTSHDNSSVLEPAQFLSNINHDIRFSTTNEGNWHKYTLHIKVGNGGYEQIWVDDTLLLDNSANGYDHSATGIAMVQFPGVIVRWFAGCEFTLDVDDLVIWHK